ncbi:hypothetical protein D7M11_35360 [Paenibacillus ginsengarvi]|uniref:Uncharacterized protein n=1 Tax=Paenibacillus ginsengarvi TaxID=400777 RepID=A0A3B0ALI1_9BACL|nr:hypothetical protein D7M11_35360 [Paenibacillus ginsengarvi]
MRIWKKHSGKTRGLHRKNNPLRKVEYVLYPKPFETKSFFVCSFVNPVPVCYSGKKLTQDTFKLIKKKGEP